MSDKYFVDTDIIMYAHDKAARTNARRRLWKSCGAIGQAW
jgi:hypothetical protein